jgi:hypothetical protein
MRYLEHLKCTLFIRSFLALGVPLLLFETWKYVLIKPESPPAGRAGLILL